MTADMRLGRAIRDFVTALDRLTLAVNEASEAIETRSANDGTLRKASTTANDRIRAWAQREFGIVVSRYGRVPQPVRDAHEAAEAGASREDVAAILFPPKTDRPRDLDAAPVRQKRASRGVPYVLVRQWARTNGIPCSDKGRPSNDLIDRFLAANQPTEEAS